MLRYFEGFLQIEEGAIRTWRLMRIAEITQKNTNMITRFYNIYLSV